MRKKIIIVMSIVLVVLAASILGLRHFGKGIWEAALWGPFQGKPYVGNLSDTPKSTLDLSDGRMEVYYLSGMSNPVLVCRSESGNLISQTLLIPERTNQNGEVETAFVREFELKKPYRCSYRTSDGTHVFITCEWEWGGKEGGLLSLNNDFSFKEMWLSW